MKIVTTNTKLASVTHFCFWLAFTVYNSVCEKIPKITPQKISRILENIVQG